MSDIPEGAELREAVAHHITWLRRGHPEWVFPDNRASADLLERLVAALDAACARLVEDSTPTEPARRGATEAES